VGVKKYPVEFKRLKQ